MEQSAARWRVVWLSLFAMAMANVEASLVVHLRSLYYSEDPLTLFPLALMSHRDLGIELLRELATVVMILSVAVLAIRGVAKRFAAFVLVFGLWDIFYYVWLKLLIGWPVTWLEWDILFLIPWPWFGPWITPALIALLFTVWGGWVLWCDRPVQFTYRRAMVFVAGAGLSLASFLLPAVPLLMKGEQAFMGYVPDDFLWWLYSLGVLGMAVSLWQAQRPGQ